MFKFIKFVIYAVFFILEAIANILTLKEFWVNTPYLTEIVIKTMNAFCDPILFTDTIVFYGVCFALSGVITLFLYKYNKLSFIENFFIKKNPNSFFLK